MKKIIKRFLVLALAALPSQGFAQNAQSPTTLPSIPPGRAVFGQLQPVSANYQQVQPGQAPGNYGGQAGQLAQAKDAPPLSNGQVAPTQAPANSTCAPTVDISDKACGTKCRCLKFEVFGEYLFWNVHNADIPFAQAFDGVDPNTSVPRGPVGIVSPNFESGIRLGAGVGLSDHSWLVGTVTYFTEATDGSIAAPPGNVLHNFLVFPNTVNSAGDSLTASARYIIDMRTADLDYKCAFVDNDHLSLYWLAGARYAHLRQNLSSTYEITGTTTTDSNINFDGGGPRIGLEGEYRILCGFYGYGKGMANLLVGQFQGSFVERNVFTGLVGQTSVSEDRLVPVLELEIGAGWQCKNGRVRISGGYYVGTWFNIMNVPSLGQGVGANNFTTNGNNMRDNMTFDGFVGRVEFRF